MATTNATILDRVWLSGTNQYQQAVPQATQAGVAQVQKAIFAPQNNMLFNQFMDGYINLVGNQRVIQQAWTNPLAKFKGGKLAFGSSLQESAVAWIKAHSYNAADEDLLKLEKPEASVWYHSLNREDKYPISVDRPALMQAFRDEYGLNKLINQIIQTPINSDNFDEYTIMINLIAGYEHNWGFYKEQVTGLPTASADNAKAFLQAMRKYADILKFPSVLYNATAFDINIPVFAQPNELVLLITADQKAAIDVQALATLFHLEKAETPEIEIVVVPELPVPNAFAVLTTKDFFVCNDVVYETGSFYDPNTLCQKYILHHWEIVSASPFVPAIMFTTAAGTTIPTLTEAVTSLTLTAEDDTLHPGESTQLDVTLNGSISGGSSEAIAVRPNSVTYELAAHDDAAEAAFDLNSRTYVDRNGVLHIQKTGWKFSATVTSYTVVVTATSTYVNPSGATTTYTAQEEITVSPAT